MNEHSRRLTGGPERLLIGFSRTTASMIKLAVPHFSFGRLSRPLYGRA
jgi:hypothetical protein